MALPWPLSSFAPPRMAAITTFTCPSSSAFLTDAETRAALP